MSLLPTPLDCIHNGRYLPAFPDQLDPTATEEMSSFDDLNLPI